MTTRMLIDARHPEETRVAVLKGNRIEEFDFESAEHKQIKGNIYLAKVTRVEPSLQAAFVDFGGNRHGFLAFSEIHPDYYQIPKEDRDALLAAEQEHAEEEARLRAEDEDSDDGQHFDDDGNDDEGSDAFAGEMAGEDGVEDVGDEESNEVSTIEDGSVSGDNSDDDNGDNGDNGDENGNRSRGRGRGRGRRQGNRGGGGTRSKAADEARAKRLALRRRYKIQDVIQRRQVLLVQVVKEERGNKGAALTTYLSLAGRYCVLMPNSSHGGGISRKISSAADRKRLKQIVAEMSLPKSMGCIVRTAGLQRTKTEIKRDFDYLARLWDEIRERTLGSSAPSLIHSDSDLIKRAIRDIYNREIEEVVVEGEAGYKSAKSFMKLLMPSHARRVKPYSDPVPLFQRYGAEDQLRAMYEPVVQLKSGGYLVINPTEALVSIDINSGRSTKEHGIEQTAVATNLEAAKEIARQLRLRDMAGLVVIDFIDMDYNSNVRKVERAMKDALKNDRARIQVGRISGFGLMEMSRQRLRTGVLEASTRECPHCDGTGLVRTASSAGLSALRLIEDEAAKGKGTQIRLSASTEAAVYLLNEKRAELQEIEQRYGVTVEVVPEGEDEGAKMTVSSSGPKPTHAPKFEPIVVDDVDDDIEEDSEDSDEEQGRNGDSDDERPKKKRRRRRGGRNRNKRRDDNDSSDNGSSDDSSDDETSGSNSDDANSDDGDTGEDKPKKRRSRGGRGRRKKSDDTTPNEAQEDVSEQVVADMPVVAGPEDTPETAEAAADEKPKPKPRRSRAKKADQPADGAESKDGKAEDAEEKPAPKKRASRARKAPAKDESGESSGAESPAENADEKPKPRRTRAKKADQGDEGAAKDTAKKPAARKPRKKAGEPSASENTTEQLTEDIAVVAGPQDTPTEPQEAAQKDEGSKAEPAPKPEPAPGAANDANGAGEDDGKPRRGWWQRTFGA